MSRRTGFHLGTSSHPFEIIKVKTCDTSVGVSDKTAGVALRA